MNIEHKKTTLGDDSILYQKRDESFQKKDLTGLSKIQKLGYFKDYYLRTVIVVGIIAAIVIMLFYNSIFHRQESFLSIAFVNDGYLADTEGFETELREYFELTNPDQLITLSNYNLEDYQQQMAYTAIMAAKDLDVLICDKEYFEKASALGMLYDLSEFLPSEQYASLSEAGAILESSVVETDYEGNVTQTYEPAPHGIQLAADNALYKKYEGFCDAPVLAFFLNSERTDTALKFADYLLAE